MKKEDFLRAIRREREKFRVDKIRINPPGDAVTGKGTLCVEEGHFTLEVTLDDPERVPQTPKGFAGVSLFWPVIGIIEDQLEFSAKGLPDSSTRHYGVKPLSSLRFRFRHLDLVPQGMDTLTHGEREDLFSRIRNPFRVRS